jgi:hypothetical protein
MKHVDELQLCLQITAIVVMRSKPSKRRMDSTFTKEPFLRSFEMDSKVLLKINMKISIPALFGYKSLSFAHRTEIWVIGGKVHAKLVGKLFVVSLSEFYWRPEVQTCSSSFMGFYGQLHVIYVKTLYQFLLMRLLLWIVWIPNVEFLTCSILEKFFKTKNKLIN